MPDDQDESQKTEEPTQKRLDDALKKGQVPNSRELTSFLMLLVFALILSMLSPSIMNRAGNNLREFVESPHLMLTDGASLLTIFSDVLADTLLLMIVPVGIIICVIFLSSLMQHPMLFSTDAPVPKMERISVFKGFKRLFSLKNVVEFVKGLFKIGVIGVISYLVITLNMPALNELAGKSSIAVLLLLSKLATQFMIGVCVFMGIVAAVDFIYQKFEHIKSLRMSKQDMKDEYKQTEGSPEVKAKLREIRNERANNRMMSSVPDADVVLTNPTHYSVALKYDAEISEAPIVVAKGQDLIALKIREIARENDVPILENPPLTRALFSSVEIDQEIPLEHYNAVAEIIKYVYKLKGRKL